MPTATTSPETAPLRRPRLGAALLALAALALAVLIAVPSLRWSQVAADAAPASVADAPAAPEAPGGTTLFVTSGLTWADVTPETTPNLHCFAEHSGTAAMALTSASVMPTKRQGLEMLADGERAAALPKTGEDGAKGDSAGAAADAPAPSAPSRPGEELDVTVAGDPAIHVVDLGDASVGRGVDEAEHAATLRAIDEAFAAAAGECGAQMQHGSGARAAVASVGALNPTADDAARVENTRGYDALPAPLNLQVYIDSGWGPAYLTSPSTRQVGTVMTIDIPATLTGAGQVGIGREMRGSPSSSGPSAAQIERAHELTVTSRATEDALGLLLGGIVAALVLGAAAATWAARSGTTDSLAGRAGRAVLQSGILAFAVGLTSSVVPLSALVAAGVPAALALGAYILLGTAVLGALVVVGCRLLVPARPLLVPAVAALFVVAVICADSATGSIAQYTSVLGNQPIYGGRFYGITNHLTGIMLACWALGTGMLIHALPVFTRGPRAALFRVLLVGITGFTVGAVAVMPSMGADAGSALIYAPVTLVACLAVSGRRMRAWHVAAALAAGLAVFVVAGLADYARPAESRTHLGEFVGAILDRGDVLGGIGEFWAVFADRAMRMMEPLWLYSPLVILPAALVVVGLTWLALRRTPLTRDAPHLYWIRAIALGGAWMGALTNDTGLVLVGLAYLTGAVLSLAAWSAWSARPEPSARGVARGTT